MGKRSLVVSELKSRNQIWHTAHMAGPLRRSCSVKDQVNKYRRQTQQAVVIKYRMKPCSEVWKHGGGHRGKRKPNDIQYVLMVCYEQHIAGYYLTTDTASYPRELKSSTFIYLWLTCVFKWRSWYVCPQCSIRTSQRTHHICDFGLPPRCQRDLRSSGVLRSVGC